MKKLLISLVLTLSLASQAWALDVPAPPHEYVRDDAEILSVSTERTLNAQIAQVEAETSAEIAVLTITSLEDDALEDFANEVFREWGVGQVGADNGVLLLISLEDRAVRIEVGYGLEGRITDFNSDKIIDDRIIPAFKAENYDLGVLEAIEDMDLLIRQEAEEEGFTTAPPATDDYSPGWLGYGSLIGLGMGIAVPALGFGFFIWIFWSIILMLLPVKAAQSMQKLPIPHMAMAAALFFVSLPALSWIAGLAMAHYIYMKLKNADVKKMREGGGGSSGGYRSGGSSSRPSSGSMGGGGRSSGQSFGGGSSGGGGASGKW